MGTILLIEDKSDDALLTKIALKELDINADLIVKKTGAEAISYIRSNISSGNPLPKIIILDINLPIMNGIEILEKFKASNYTKAIPIIVFTSSDLISDISYCYKLGAKLFLKKPNNINDFRNAIKKIQEVCLT